MTFATAIITVSGFGEFAVWANACLRIHAPEQAIVAPRYAGIWLRVNEQTFPT